MADQHPIKVHSLLGKDIQGLTAEGRQLNRRVEIKIRANEA